MRVGWQNKAGNSVNSGGNGNGGNNGSSSNNNVVGQQ